MDAGEEPPEADEQSILDEEAAAMEEGQEEEEEQEEEPAEDELPPPGPYTFNQTEDGEDDAEVAGGAEDDQDGQAEVDADKAKRRVKRFTYAPRPKEEPSELAVQAFDAVRNGGVVDGSMTLELIRERASSSHVASCGVWGRDSVLLRRTRHC